MRAARLSSVTLLFAACLTAAEQGSDAGSQFTPYLEAFESQLSTMLQNAQSPTRLGLQNQTGSERTVPPETHAVETGAFTTRYWSGRESSLAAALERLDHLRPRMEPILAVEGVPRELLAVVLVESGAQTLVTSPRQARGLWQFIPETARQYGLTVDERKDERVEVEAATRAAAHYLRDLHSHFGNWALAFAAYNAGQKAVDEALERGHATTFWELRSTGLLPQETREYVPAVLTAINLLRSVQVPPTAAAGIQSANWVFASSRRTH